MPYLAGLAHWRFPRDRALLSAQQQEELTEALKKPPPDGGMWNSPKVGEWIEQRTGKVLTQKKQRGWEYMRKLGNTPRFPGLLTRRPINISRRPSKKALDEGYEVQGELSNGQGRAVV